MTDRSIESRPTTGVVADWMRGRHFQAAKATYHCEEAYETFVVFGATGSTGKVMLPTSLVLEWVLAYEQGRLGSYLDPRAMRDIAKQGSPWAKQLHSFETHLAAVVRQWAETHD